MMIKMFNLVGAPIPDGAGCLAEQKPEPWHVGVVHVAQHLKGFLIGKATFNVGTGRIVQCSVDYKLGHRFHVALVQIFVAADLVKSKTHECKSTADHYQRLYGVRVNNGC